MREKTLQNFLNKYRLRACICFITIFMCVPGVFAADLDEILNNLEKKYSKNEFTAVFFQTSRLKALDINETASGKATFSHPGKMVWEYSEPQQHSMITNGKMLWVYRPEQNQVMVGKAENFFKEGFGGAFLSDISIIRDKYSISINKENETSFELKLIPNQESPDIKSVFVVVSKKDSVIEKLTTYNIYEDTIEIEFHNIEFKDVDNNAFEFSIPEGTSVINLDSQEDL